jgi:hypothetical protein
MGRPACIHIGSTQVGWDDRCAVRHAGSMFAIQVRPQQQTCRSMCVQVDQLLPCLCLVSFSGLILVVASFSGLILVVVCKCTRHSYSSSLIVFSFWSHLWDGPSVTKAELGRPWHYAARPPVVHYAKLYYCMMANLLLKEHALNKYMIAHDCEKWNR